MDEARNLESMPERTFPYVHAVTDSLKKDKGRAIFVSLKATLSETHRPAVRKIARSDYCHYFYY